MQNPGRLFFIIDWALKLEALEERLKKNKKTVRFSMWCSFGTKAFNLPKRDGNINLGQGILYRNETELAIIVSAM